MLYLEDNRRVAPCYLLFASKTFKACKSACYFSVKKQKALCVDSPFGKLRPQSIYTLFSEGI